MIPLNENTILFDTETTGVDSTAEIVEISIIDYTGKVLFDSLIKPFKPIPEAATKIHGITNEMVNGSPSFKDVSQELWLIFSKYGTNIAYNSDFDCRILMQTSKLYGKDEARWHTVKSRSICAMKTYTKLRSLTTWPKLINACSVENVDLSGINKSHRALADCLILLALIKTIQINSLNLQPGITKVRYIGNSPENLNKVGIYDRMIPNSHAARILIDEKVRIWSITNLEEIKEMPENEINANNLSQSNSLRINTEIDFEPTYTLPCLVFDETAFNIAIEKALAPVKALGNKLEEKEISDLLANLRRFDKAINEKRKEISKAVKAPIDDFEIKIKKGCNTIAQYINTYEAELNVIKAKKKIYKRIGIEKEIAEIIQMFELDSFRSKYLDVKEDYYLSKWTMPKIIEDLKARAQELFKAQDHERISAELKNAKVDARNSLITKLNQQYDFIVAYSQTPVEGEIGGMTDEKVNEYFAHKFMQKQAFDAERNRLNQLKIDSSSIVSGGASTIIKGNVIHPPRVTEAIADLAEEMSTSLLLAKPEILEIFQNWRISAGTSGLSKMGMIKLIQELRSRGLTVEILA